jgi:hypothetical protein
MAHPPPVPSPTSAPPPPPPDGLPRVIHATHVPGDGGAAEGAVVIHDNGRELITHLLNLEGGFYWCGHYFPYDRADSAWAESAARIERSF